MRHQPEPCTSASPRLSCVCPPCQLLGNRDRGRYSFGAAYEKGSQDGAIYIGRVQHASQRQVNDALQRSALVVHHRLRSTKKVIINKKTREIIQQVDMRSSAPSAENFAVVSLRHIRHQLYAELVDFAQHFRWKFTTSCCTTVNELLHKFLHKQCKRVFRQQFFARTSVPAYRTPYVICIRIFGRRGGTYVGLPFSCHDSLFFNSC